MDGVGLPWKDQVSNLSALLAPALQLDKPSAAVARSVLPALTGISAPSLLDKGLPDHGYVGPSDLKA